MSRREEYEQKTEAILTPIVESRGFELVDVEYVKEAGTWYLRGYIDKPGGITVNDCEDVSRAFSDILDEQDFIEDSYIMEIMGQVRPNKTVFAQQEGGALPRQVPAEAPLGTVNKQRQGITMEVVPCLLILSYPRFLFSKSKGVREVSGRLRFL